MKIQSVKKIAKIRETTNKKLKKCPMCGQMFASKFKIVCPVCEWDARN